MEQVAEQQPGRTCADNAYLRAESRQRELT
jgi:hypothetical protein